ncbi:MAG: hypothetical protein Q9174_004755, partial [Haloplaca sp. 1 TL-2023]
MSTEERPSRQSSTAARPTLADRLERLQNRSPSSLDLLEFGRVLDVECLLRSREGEHHDVASNGTLLEIALCLSGPLLQWRGSDSGRFRNLQLRALVAALALLHHTGLTDLNADPYDRLRINIANQFNNIVGGDSQLRLEDRMRKENALYLIRLVAQYFSLLRRAQALDEAISIPIIGLALAGASMASGQYNSLRSVFRHFDQIIGLLPARKGAHLNLPAIQELTRIATTLMQNKDANGERSAPDAAKAQDIVDFVQQLLRDNMDRVPSRKSDGWNWPLARFRLGPPMMNQWYFFYGLLDCYAQLAQYIRPEDMPADIVAQLKTLLVTSEWEQLRWKVMEILQGSNPTSIAIHHWLESLHNTGDIEEPSDMLRAVNSVLEDTMSYDGTVAVEAPLQEISPSPTTSSQGTHASLWNARWSLSTQSAETPFSGLVDRRMTGLTLGEVQPSSTLDQNEALPVIASEGDLRRWSPGESTQVQSVLPSRGCSKHSFNHAGLSPDCSLVYFHEPRRVMACRLPNDIRTNDQSTVVMDRKFDRKTHVSDVSLSSTMLAISTRDQLEIYQFDGNRFGSQPTDIISHENRDPSGLTVCERTVAIGYRGGTEESCKGRICRGHIVAYRIPFKVGETSNLIKLLEHCLPMQDMPKSLSIQDMGRYLIAITDKQHYVLVWSIDGDVVEENPFIIRGYRHKP